MKRKREVVALVLLPLIYLYIVKLPPVFFFVLVLLVSSVAQWEFYSMYRVKGLFKAVGLLSGGLVGYFFYLGHLRGVFYVVVIFFCLTVLLRLLSVGKGPENALLDMSPVITGFLYIPVLTGFVIMIRAIGPGWVIYAGAVAWASDSCAYYIGKRYGRRKLYPSVSPNKTVAGVVGSAGGGVVSSVLIKVFLLQSMSFDHAFLLGLIVGSVTVLGDLAESMFKRDAGVKDSSHLIPGHGGVLDKIDGIVFVTPVVYVYLRFFLIY